MKTKLLFASLLIFGLNLTEQNLVCFSTPDGTDVNGWSYKDYVIPAGYKIDSVMFTATRPGYPSSQDAFNMFYCPSSSSYSNCTGGKTTLDYSNFSTSMYNIWLQVDTANLVASGMVRVVLPTNAGAVWNQVCFAISSLNISCYTTPDGTDVNSWSYKDYVIPTGFKIDSVIFTATRPGYPSSQDAFNMFYCPSSSSYTNCTGGKTTLDYSNFSTSMYDIWLRVDTANLTASGMVRVVLPTNAGAVWNQVCFATSLQSTTGIKQLSNNNQLTIYPNPTSDYISIQGADKITNIDVLTIDGQLIKSIPNYNGSIDVSDLESGLYFLKVIVNGEQNVKKFVKQ